MEGIGFGCDVACGTCGGTSCRDRVNATDLSFSAYCTGMIDLPCLPNAPTPCIIGAVQLLNFCE